MPTNHQKHLLWTHSGTLYKMLRELPGYRRNDHCLWGITQKEDNIHCNILGLAANPDKHAYVLKQVL